MTSFHEVRIFAATMHMDLPYRFSAAEMTHLFHSMGRAITSECCARGMTFLGHLKGIATGDRSGTVRFNQTVPECPIDVVCDWQGRDYSCDVVINVLAFGNDDFDIAASCQAAIYSVFDRFVIKGTVIPADSQGMARESDARIIQIGGGGLRGGERGE
jgi:hypothetical protein